MKITKSHVYFWSGIFSNFYPAHFEYTIENLKYEFNCSEQFYMFIKAKYFNDLVTANKILTETNPKIQKKLGREVKNFDQIKWDKIKETVMYVAVHQKFKQNKILMKKLIETDHRIIVEASPYDRIWGVGLSEKDPLILDSRNWIGQNLLGKVLMRVRSIYNLEKHFNDG